MKRQALMILTTLSLLVMLTATSVYAQCDMRLEVNIPFAFFVGNNILPAGKYTVSHMIQGLLLIRSEDGSAVQIFSTLDTQASKSRDESSLVFNRYGDQHFLATIWTAGTDTGHVLYEFRAEREISRARHALAKSGAARKTVSIIARR
jgi:hypothetical protein